MDAMCCGQKQRSKQTKNKQKNSVAEKEYMFKKLIK